VPYGLMLLQRAVMLRFTGQEAPVEHDLARITRCCSRFVQGKAPTGLIGGRERTPTSTGVRQTRTTQYLPLPSTAAVKSIDPDKVVE
jgi:hypothetical protein